MKIIVCIKQVPERDAQVRISGSGKWIEESDIQFAMNESDAYALEEALQLKEKHGGKSSFSVPALSAGLRDSVGGHTCAAAPLSSAGRAATLTMRPPWPAASIAFTAARQQRKQGVEIVIDLRH